MTTRELERLCGMKIEPRVVWVVAPDGRVYRPVGAGEWEAYPDYPQPLPEEERAA